MYCSLIRTITQFLDEEFSSKLEVLKYKEVEEGIEVWSETFLYRQFLYKNHKLDMETVFAKIPILKRENGYRLVSI